MAYHPAQWLPTNPIDDDNLFSLIQQAAQPALTLDPTRFPAPAVDNPTPPASEESSPSPPSITEREQFAAQAARQTRSAANAEDESAKRGRDDMSDSDDSGYEQPSKHQHRSGDRDGVGSGPRRSTGGTKKKGVAADENRALKRKEQNRAAQRAFRERKERHVKELEDQVADLEARVADRDRESENLKDLLGRLQNENLLLKQSAFTFSFPAGANNTDGSGAAPTSANAAHNPAIASMNQPPSPKLPSPTSSSNPSSPENTTGDVPQSILFARPDSSVTGLAGTNSVSSASSPQSEVTPSRFQSSPGAFGLNPTVPDSTGLDANFFGGDLNLLHNAKSNNVNGITTIAANPNYMSFGDPTLDPMAWASFGPADYATGSPTIPNPADLDIYGVSPYGNNGAATVANGGGSYGNMDDLFGAAPTTGSGVTPSFLALDSNQSGTQSTASSSVGGRTFSASSPSTLGTNSEVNGSATGKKDDTCPKTVEDVHRMQQSMPPSTFGPPVNITVPSPGSTKSSSSPGSFPERGDNEQGHASAHARMAALCADLPRTTKRPNQIEIGRAWEKIRQHQGFKDCDIDELCSELSAKARCDGSRPVLEEASFNNIVQSLATVHNKRAAMA